jgi:hypothetical protein
MFTLIANANNKRDLKFDGVYLSSDNRSYYISCVHGNKEGELSIQWNDKYIRVAPNKIKSKIKELTGIEIKHNSKVIIHPCHPKTVIEKFGNSLTNNNIDVIGYWKENSGHSPVFSVREFEDKKVIKAINVFIYSNLEVPQIVLR